MRCGYYNSISQPLTLTGVILITLQPVLSEVSMQERCPPYTESKKMPGWSSWCPSKGGVYITASQTKDSRVTGANSSPFK